MGKSVWFGWTICVLVPSDSIISNYHRRARALGLTKLCLLVSYLDQLGFETEDHFFYINPVEVFVFKKIILSKKVFFFKLSRAN